MSENKITPVEKSISADWFVRGVLTRVGEIFDRLTGRSWKPSSSLATSELTERLKLLLDAEAKDIGGGRMFVPHNIKLKMQWDKFSTDAGTTLKTLENELLIAAIDHINDKRYYTYAPIKLEIKPDYFTEGVKLSAGFDNFGDETKENDAAINVSIPDLKNVIVNQTPELPAAPSKELFTASFTVKNKPRTKDLAFAERGRLSVGRTKENDLWLDDQSVSKIHAALVLNSDKQLMVADTGSTNGTFINGERIAYGRAFVLKNADKLKFGTVEVRLERQIREASNDELDDGEVAVEESSNGEMTIPIVEENHIGNQTISINSNSTAKTNETKIEEQASPTEPRVALDFEK